MGWFDWLSWRKKTDPASPQGHDIELPAEPEAGTFSPSEACIELIEEQEGLIHTAQPDVDGVYILGYGCKWIDGKPVVKGQTIDDEGADRNCRSHAQTCANAILPLVKRQLKQGELDALVDFVYNAGIGALQQSTLLRTINSNQPVLEDYFTRWNKAHVNGVVVVLPGLTARRKAEYLLWSS